MESIEIRQVSSRQELEQCFDLWKLVFSQESREFFQERLDFDASYSFETTWIATVDGVIASAIQIFPYRSRLGSLSLLAGGIGSVATHPNYRGKGLAQEILFAQSKWMKEHDYSLSLLLTGIHSFYEQVGWRTVTESVYQFDSSSINCCVVPNEFTFGYADNEGHFESIGEIYDSFNRERTNSVVRTPAYWKDQMKWKHESGDNFLLAFEDDMPTAYIRFQTNNRKLTVTESCYTGNGRQVTMLFQQLCAQFPDHHIEIRIPDDHVLTNLFEQNGIQKITFSGCMWRIFDFHKIMNDLEHTFATRISDLDIPEPREVLIRCGHDAVVISIDPSKSIRVRQVSHECNFHERISLNEQEFLTLLLQGCGNASVERLKNSQTIEWLFPNQNSMMWSADFF